MLRAAVLSAARLSPLVLRRIEQRIAKAGHRLDVLVPARKGPQRLQAGDRRQHRYRLPLQQPRGIAIAVELVGDRQLAGFSVTSRWNGSAVSAPDGTTSRLRLSFISASTGAEQRA